MTNVAWRMLLLRDRDEGSQNRSSPYSYSFILQKIFLEEITQKFAKKYYFLLLQGI